MKKAKIPARIKNYVFSTFNCCVACGTWDANTCGHIIPESHGGAMVESNFMRLCHNCNSVQGACVVNFRGFAKLDESLTVAESRALIQSRRAQWAKTCSLSRSNYGKNKDIYYQPLDN